MLVTKCKAEIAFQLFRLCCGYCIIFFFRQEIHHTGEDLLEVIIGCCPAGCKANAAFIPAQYRFPCNLRKTPACHCSRSFRTNLV